MKRGKVIIVSAPSGAGKSTIIKYILSKGADLSFSVSATSRPPRGTEQNGVEYYFLSLEEFMEKVKNNEFLEYEEVYPGRFYGTLKAPVEQQLEQGYNVVFDVDVKGGCSIKNYFKEKALGIFIQPPSIEELRNRLVKRGTDSPEVIEDRIARAEYELTFASKFDAIVVNDVLEIAEEEALHLVETFLQEDEKAQEDED